MSNRADDFSDDDIFSDGPPPTPSLSTRSEPGKGEICTIYCVGPSVGFTPNEDAEIWQQEAEDYASTSWPVVLKVKNNVTQAELASYLKALLRCIEHDFRGTISAENIDDELRLEGLI